MHTITVQSLSHYSRNRYIRFICIYCIYLHSNAVTLVWGRTWAITSWKNTNNTHSNKIKTLKSTNVKSKPWLELWPSESQFWWNTNWTIQSMQLGGIRHIRHKLTQAISNDRIIFVYHTYYNLIKYYRVYLMVC